MTEILVIEDEANILENILETLELEGFDAHGAVNGREGIEKARSLVPDMILCDIMMPEVNGYDVLMSLRTEVETATIPFIFLSALGARNEVRQGMQLGADDYIAKPFTPAELIAAIQTRLEKQAVITKKYDEAMATLRNGIVFALPHEFRTPLTGLMGCGDYLASEYDTIDPESIRDMGDVILRSAMRLQRLAENYLTYAQISLYADEPDTIAKMMSETLDYASEVVVTVANEEATTADRREDLILEIDEGAVMMLYDNFAKIISELTINAFKFSEPGSPVTVSAHTDDDGGYEIVVADEGRGMSPEEINAIGAYMQFRRAMYEQQGLGLGLIIAKRLVEIHGGSFHLESVEGQGTAITLQFPPPTSY